MCAEGEQRLWRHLMRKTRPLGLSVHRRAGDLAGAALSSGIEKNDRIGLADRLGKFGSKLTEKQNLCPRGWQDSL